MSKAVAKSEHNKLFLELLVISEAFLGPAAERFLVAQIEHHLHKPTSEITVSDLKNLIEWLRLSLVFISQDPDEIAQYTKELRRLAQSR